MSVVLGEEKAKMLSFRRSLIAKKKRRAAKVKDRDVAVAAPIRP